MADSDSEKTEKPTGKRKSQARKEGNVAKSQEVSTALFLLISVLFFKMAGSGLMNRIKNYLSHSLANINYELTPLNTHTLFIDTVISYFKIFAPFAFILLFITFLASIIQVGWLYTTKPLKPNWNFIKLSKAFKQFFDFGAYKRLIKGLLKIILLSVIAYFTVKKEIMILMGLSEFTVQQIFSHTAKMVIKIFMNILYFYIILAIADYVVTKFQHLKKLKMTKQEVKDEFKQMQGDPQIKNKLRSLMFQQSMKRMMEDVPKADVVITNPIHLAVALKYKPGDDDAPTVLAKGKRKLAERIKEIARKHDIPIIENKPLARMLYKNSEVGREIPIDLYGAVAEVLAHVYNLKNKK